LGIWSTERALGCGIVFPILRRSSKEKERGQKGSLDGVFEEFLFRIKLNFGIKKLYFLKEI